MNTQFIQHEIKRIEKIPYKYRTREQDGQLQAYRIILGEILKEEGMASASESVAGTWADQAIDMLEGYLKFQNEPFMAEDFREFAAGNGLPEPRTRMAFGGVMVRAKKMGLIKFVGYGLVKNPRAHRTPASVYEKVVS